MRQQRSPNPFIFSGDVCESLTLIVTSARICVLFGVSAEHAITVAVPIESCELSGAIEEVPKTNTNICTHCRTKNNMQINCAPLLWVPFNASSHILSHQCGVDACKHEEMKASGQCAEKKFFFSAQNRTKPIFYERFCYILLVFSANETWMRIRTIATRSRKNIDFSPTRLDSRALLWLFFFWLKCGLWMDLPIEFRGWSHSHRKAKRNSYREMR